MILSLSWTCGSATVCYTSGSKDVDCAALWICPMIGTSESRAHVIHPTGTFGISSQNCTWSIPISFLNLLSHQRNFHSSVGCRLWNQLDRCLGNVRNPAQHGLRSSEGN